MNIKIKKLNFNLKNKNKILLKYIKMLKI